MKNSSRRAFVTRAIATATTAITLRAPAFAEGDIPLDPGNGGQSILPAALQPGDILLSTTSSIESEIIRKVTSGPVSHAAVYLGQVNGVLSIIEAQSPKIFVDKLQNAIDHDTLLVAFRYPNIKSDQQKSVVEWFKAHAGTPFNKWGAVRDWVAQFLGLPRHVNLQTPGNGFYCSQLVIAGYDAAGLALIKSPAQWTPNDIANLAWTDQLHYVGHLQFVPQ